MGIFAFGIMIVLTGGLAALISGVLLSTLAGLGFLFEVAHIMECFAD